MNEELICKQCGRTRCYDVTIDGIHQFVCAWNGLNQHAYYEVIGSEFFENKDQEFVIE